MMSGVIPINRLCDGMEWIYTAAVHCLYKRSTVSIRQHADDAHKSLLLYTDYYTREVPWVYHNMLMMLTSHAHNLMIFHDERCTSNSSTLHMTWLSNIVQIAGVINMWWKKLFPLREITSQFLHDDMTQ